MLLLFEDYQLENWTLVHNSQVKIRDLNFFFFLRESEWYFVKERFDIFLKNNNNRVTYNGTLFS